MPSARQASAIEESTWFQTRWAPYLLVDADLRIRAVNTAYEHVSAHPRDSLVGERLFDVFPDNPANPEADGVANVSASAGAGLPPRGPALDGRAAL
jgi:nitrogen-specific signal transduction histidine kinase